jgi:hypothetical protein
MKRSDWGWQAYPSPHNPEWGLNINIQPFGLRRVDVFTVSPNRFASLGVIHFQSFGLQSRVMCIVATKSFLHAISRRHHLDAIGDVACEHLSTKYYVANEAS